MPAADWGAWIGYELVVAVATVAKTGVWFQRPFRVTRARLEGWVGLLLLAFFAGLGLGQWLGAIFLATLIAFGLASAMIVGAAVNAAYEVGLRNGERVRDTEAGKPIGV